MHHAQHQVFIKEHMGYTQRKLILMYIAEYGSFLPAKMSGVIYKKKMFGHSVDRRCRELRKEGILRSEGVGKFEKFFRVNQPKFVWVYEGEIALKKYI